MILKHEEVNNINLIAKKGLIELENGSGSAPPHTRAASWSGSYTGLHNTKPGEINPLDEALGMRHYQSYMMPGSPIPTAFLLGMTFM